MKTEFKTPEVIPPDPMMERMVRNTKYQLAEISKNGKGKFKIRTASGCFNEFVVYKAPSLQKQNAHNLLQINQ